MSREDWKRIVPILETIKERDLHRLSAIHAELVRVEIDLAKLDVLHRTESCRADAAPTVPASGVVEAWLDWETNRRMEINRRRAELRAEQELRRNELRRSIGRLDAVSRLAAQGPAGRRHGRS